MNFNLGETLLIYDMTCRRIYELEKYFYREDLKHYFDLKKKCEDAILSYGITGEGHTATMYGLSESEKLDGH